MDISTQKKNKKQQNTILLLVIMLTVILIMQLDDAFCTNLYEKLQSFFITDFLIVGKHMDENTATATLGLAMLPCYAITALAPIARSLVDRFGKRPIFLLNIVVLILGCAICMVSNHLILYLIGNAIVTFSVSMDIQCIYIVDELPFKLRGTAKGLSSGVAAVAAMCIPVLRALLIDKQNLSWKSIYLVGILSSLIVLLITWLLLAYHARFRVKQPNSMPSEPLQTDDLHANDHSQPHTNLFVELIKFPFKNKSIRIYLILLFVLGLATAGISFYNEPLISFAIKQEKTIDYILFIQPIVLFLITFLSGLLFDHIGRMKTIFLSTLIAIIAITIFVINVYTTPAPLVLAINWGAMVGGYFSAIDLLNILVIENSSEKNRGKASAIATVLYGAGDAVGMLTVSIVAKALSSGAAKLIFSLPFLFAGIILILITSVRNRCT